MPVKKLGNLIVRNCYRLALFFRFLGLLQDQGNHQLDDERSQQLNHWPDQGKRDEPDKVLFS